VIGTLRRNGNSIVVTIPPEELERIGAAAGDLVDIEIRPVDVRPRLTPELEAMLQVELKNGREALDFLGRS
jgi:antitoxin component of MazEF toxin-antitoxin module